MEFSTTQEDALILALGLKLKGVGCRQASYPHILESILRASIKPDGKRRLFNLPYSEKYHENIPQKRGPDKIIVPGYVFANYDSDYKPNLVGRTLEYWKEKRSEDPYNYFNKCLIAREFMEDEDMNKIRDASFKRGEIYGLMVVLMSELDSDSEGRMMHDKPGIFYSRTPLFIIPKLKWREKRKVDAFAKRYEVPGDIGKKRLAGEID